MWKICRVRHATGWTAYASLRRLWLWLRLLRRTNLIIAWDVEGNWVSPGDTHVFPRPRACLLCMAWACPLCGTTWDNGMTKSSLFQRFFLAFKTKVNCCTTTVEAKKVEWRLFPNCITYQAANISCQVADTKGTRRVYNTWMINPKIAVPKQYSCCSSNHSRTTDSSTAGRQQHIIPGTRYIISNNRSNKPTTSALR